MADTMTEIIFMTVLATLSRQLMPSISPLPLGGKCE